MLSTDETSAACAFDVLAEMADRVRWTLLTARSVARVSGARDKDDGPITGVREARGCVGDAGLGEGEGAACGAGEVGAVGELLPTGSSLVTLATAVDGTVLVTATTVRVSEGTAPVTDVTVPVRWSTTLVAGRVTEPDTTAPKGRFASVIVVERAAVVWSTVFATLVLTWFVVSVTPAVVLTTVVVACGVIWFRAPVTATVA